MKAKGQRDANSAGKQGLRCCLSILPGNYEGEDERVNTNGIKGNTGYLPMIRTVSETNISQGTPKMKHQLLN